MTRRAGALALAVLLAGAAVAMAGAPDSVRTPVRTSVIDRHAVPGIAAEDSILGRWSGSVTCVRAPWNAGCHDDAVRYEFVRVSEGDVGIVLHASRRAADRWVPVFELPVRWWPNARLWSCDDMNVRGPLRWEYRVSGDSLVGLVRQLPDGTVARTMIARRPAAPQ